MALWTPVLLVGRTQTCQQNSGNNNSAFQENKNEEFSEEAMINTTCVATEGQHQSGWSEGAAAK